VNGKHRGRGPLWGSGFLAGFLSQCFSEQLQPCTGDLYPGTQRRSETELFDAAHLQKRFQIFFDVFQFPGELRAELFFCLHLAFGSLLPASTVRFQNG
jgi:hypothetical protein